MARMVLFTILGQSSKLVVRASGHHHPASLRFSSAFDILALFHSNFGGMKGQVQGRAHVSSVLAGLSGG
jgi:hypothetical protein